MALLNDLENALSLFDLIVACTGSSPRTHAFATWSATTVLHTESAAAFEGTSSNSMRGSKKTLVSFALRHKQRDT